MANSPTSSDDEDADDSDGDDTPLIGKDSKQSTRRRRKKRDKDEQEAWWKWWPDKKKGAQKPTQDREGNKDADKSPDKPADEEAGPTAPDTEEVPQEEGHEKEGGWKGEPDKKEEPSLKKADEEHPEDESPWKKLPPSAAGVSSEVYTLRDFLKEARAEYRKFVAEHPRDALVMRMLCNRCVNDLIVVAIYCGLGAFAFKFTEGTFESFYKCGVKRVKRDFVDELWRSSHFMKEDEWKSKARRKLMDFENQLQEAFDAGLTTYSGHRSWSFLNSVIYAFTVVTTIGYGHIAPSTTTGRALTIVYAIFGIPMFLILLADFGKMFTRGIKWIWAFVRRLYYTGSCKKVRRTGPVKEVMKGVQVMYDMATFRRPSQAEGGGSGEPPSTPAPSNFAIDDEFNLPITVAITILLIYIFCGAIVFYIWENSWSFFESFYFVFISMSTIGFGDFVPQNKMYMMASIVYLAFGLALTTMCINVVQEKLSDTFRQATAKIGATIGLKVSEEDGTVTPATPANVELAQVHKSPSQITT
ncbi:hypothetical protein AAG570_009652 [Ranatra chinensis]|uniref:Potassium channel domain-containing protein n=1 Tax=Ranatra chinensis TaxID=642074 RepID=A0ABD0YPU6_9HEMI